MKIQKPQKNSKTKELISKSFNYENDKEYIFKKSEKRAWFITYTSIFLLVISFVGYFFLLPLKEVQPYILGFDRSTGIVDPISVLNEETINENEALDKYFINQYIQLRESYVYQTIQRTYELTQIFSSSEVAEEFRESYNKEDSLDSILGTGKAIVKVNSITLEKINDSHLAIARINVVYKNQKNEEFTKNFVVRLSYVYDPQIKFNLSQRIENPLGFFVTSYQKTEENL